MEFLQSFNNCRCYWWDWDWLKNWVKKVDASGNTVLDEDGEPVLKKLTGPQELFLQ